MKNLRYVVEIETRDVTLDIYCGICRRRCRISRGPMHTDAYCKKHGHQARVIQGIE